MAVDVYLDPSFSGTGIFTVDEGGKQGNFYLIGSSEVKKSLEAYWKHSWDLGNSLYQLLTGWGSVSNVYMESPFIRTFSSESLHMLQFAYLKALKDAYVYLEVEQSFIYTIPASYISGAVTREFKARGLTEPKRKQTARNQLTSLVLEELEADGWTFFGKDLIGAKGSDDCATAFLFWVLRKKENKEFQTIQLSW
jgi:hypothetical protein